MAPFRFAKSHRTLLVAPAILLTLLEIAAELKPTLVSQFAFVEWGAELRHRTLGEMCDVKRPCAVVLET